MPWSPSSPASTGIFLPPSTALTLTKRREAATFKAIAEEETLAPEAQPEEEISPSADQAVSVPVSPSDMVTMFFKAEGMMNDSATIKISKALETNGFKNLEKNVSNERNC